MNSPTIRNLWTIAFLALGGCLLAGAPFAEAGPVRATGLAPGLTEALSEGAEESAKAHLHTELITYHMDIILQAVGRAYSPTSHSHLSPLAWVESPAGCAAFHSTLAPRVAGPVFTCQLRR